MKNKQDKVINANSVFIFLIDLLIGQDGQDGQIGKIGQSGLVVRVKGGRNCSLFFSKRCF